MYLMYIYVCCEVKTTFAEDGPRKLSFPRKWFFTYSGQSEVGTSKRCNLNAFHLIMMESMCMGGRVILKEFFRAQVLVLLTPSDALTKRDSRKPLDIRIGSNAMPCIANGFKDAENSRAQGTAKKRQTCCSKRKTLGDILRG